MAMTNRNHSALPQPPRSWLRKMSMTTITAIQIHRKNRTKYNIDRNTLSSGYWNSWANTAVSSVWQCA